MTAKLLSFRADGALLARLEVYRRREDRRLADVLRRLVIRALTAEERKQRRADRAKKTQAA